MAKLDKAAFLKEAKSLSTAPAQLAYLTDTVGQLLERIASLESKPKQGRSENRSREVEQKMEDRD
jgi:hypothetical protein